MTKTPDSKTNSGGSSLEACPFPFACSLAKLCAMLFTFCFLFAQALAAPVDSTSARRIALQFLEQSATTAAHVQSRAADGVGERSVRLTHFPRAWFAMAGSRFVLVATDDADAPLLGYGALPTSQQTGGLNGEMPAPLRAMLSGVRPASAAYPPSGVDGWSTVEPLLTTVRSQYAPYNNLCPLYRHSDGTEERSIVGCVATAMEQVLTYHRQPITLLDTLHGWTTDRYEVADVLPGQTIDTRIIRNDYEREQCSEEEIDAVARLSYYLGMAAHMSWSPSSSGANSTQLVEPLQRVFGMHYVQHLDSYQYDPTDYWNFIAREIQARRPVYYAGYIMRTGGHAFVLDGLDANGLFHVNWGYGGSYDGYFRLDVLCFAQPEADRLTEFVDDGFFCNQEAIAVSPLPQPDAQVPDTLERDGGEVIVDSVIIPIEPRTGRYTPLRVYVRNTSATQAYTTPFAVLENLPTDTLLAEQAEWLSLTGCTLEPLESRMLTIHTQFSRSGSLLLSLTPDGERISITLPITVAEGGTQAFQVDELQVSFPSATSATITQHIANASAEERAAQFFIYDLTTDDGDIDWQITHYVYLDASADTTDTATFHGLTPGRSYQLNLRQRWPIVASVAFTMPGTEGTHNATIPSAAAEGEAWFTLQGIRLAAEPICPGLYVRRASGRSEKIIRR